MPKIHEVIYTGKWMVTRSILAGGTPTAKITENGLTGGCLLEFIERVGADGKVTARNFAKNFFYQFGEVAYVGLSENLDSKKLYEISQSVLRVLPDKPEIILMICGTDAMEQVARYLQKNLGEALIQTGTRLVLTGANKPLSNPRTDFWDNLEFAYESAIKNTIPGVYVAFHHRLIPADLVVKEPFNGKEMNYTSRNNLWYRAAKARRFVSDYVTIGILWTKLGGKKATKAEMVEYPVNVIRDDHNEFRQSLDKKPARAVLLVLYHGSTANANPENPDASVAKLVRDINRKYNTLFFAVTENGEPVRLDNTSYETSVALNEAGVYSLGDMTRRVALAKLNWCGYGDNEKIAERMQTNYAGEIDERLIA